MKTLQSVVSLLTLFVPALLFAQSATPSKQEAWIGTWKYDPNNPKGENNPPGGTGGAKFERLGENIKFTFDEVNAGGRVLHAEWIGKFDGNDYPVSGMINHDTEAFSRIDDHTFSRIDRKRGELFRARIVIFSQDGRTMTSFGIVKTGRGDLAHNIAVYERLN